MQLKSLFRKKSIKSILEDLSLRESHGNGLNKQLNIVDLTSLGIAAIIGAGIFSTVGGACFDGGPAVSLLFIGIAIACGFTALCYAEFASKVPISGSAYTYSYAVFGEIIAWIIGWDLILEYAIGNIAVSIGWSGNFTKFLQECGVIIPAFLTTSYLDAKNNIPDLWASAPRIFGNIPLIINLPAFVINIIITLLVYVGIKETKRFANGMVVFKIGVILIVILIGCFYVTPANWVPFAPNGFGGVLKGVSSVFFAYIGFDAISTTAEECKNPQKDLPRSMLYSLLIATVLYVLITLVLTGMVKYTDLNNEAFMANAFSQIGLNWIGGLIAFSALIATASVLLVFQIGQPRIWMSMSRDGLLPKRFSKIHPKFQTPSFATIATGLLVGIPSLFLDADLVGDMCSIGTLFAFVLVCGGIIALNNSKNDVPSKFKVTFIDAKYFLPPLFLITAFAMYKYNYISILIEGNTYYHLIPFVLFVITFIILIIASFKFRVSLIPSLGLLLCLYFMTGINIESWVRFVIWLVIGLVIYAIYGRKKSRLNQ
jgi:APA family basic amino acid/polyamine antiporter